MHSFWMSTHDLPSGVGPKADRKRDIVELYSGHMHHLREQVNGVPEPETRHLYERLVEGRLNRVLVER